MTDWYTFCRDLCSWNLLQRPVRLGGPGHIVAIDESVVAKAKPATNRHARPVPPQWVFGAVDITTGEFFMELVARRDASTLIPIIQQHVIPGSRVWSDEWAAYNGLGAASYVHETVNHSQHFVNTRTTLKPDGQLVRPRCAVVTVSPETCCHSTLTNTCGERGALARSALTTFWILLYVAILFEKVRRAARLLSWRHLAAFYFYVIFLVAE